ncbi:MAG: hypothetical protein FWF35_02925 [Elusimicrobia bacterium]|nr:hypothetical protein [Elusimicrobiota bacterium]
MKTLYGGLTFTELAVVVLFFCFSAALSFPKYAVSVEKSRAAEALKIGKDIKDAQERYYMKNNQYAKDFADLDIIVGSGRGTAVTQGKFVFNLLPQGYTYIFPAGGENLNKYWFDYYYSHGARPGAIACRTYKKRYSKICASVGGEKDSSVYEWFINQ